MSGRAARSLVSTSRLRNQGIIYVVGPIVELNVGLCSHIECHRGHLEGLDAAGMQYGLGLHRLYCHRPSCWGACGEGPRSYYRQMAPTMQQQFTLEKG